MASVEGRQCTGHSRPSVGVQHAQRSCIWRSLWGTHEIWESRGVYISKALMSCGGVLRPEPLLLCPAMYKILICKTFPPNLVLRNSKRHNLVINKELKAGYPHGNTPFKWCPLGKIVKPPKSQGWHKWKSKIQVAPHGAYFEVVATSQLDELVPSCSLSLISTSYRSVTAII